jgi:hypothetical protein
MSVDGFHNFWQFFLKKIQITVSAYFYEITYLLCATETNSSGSLFLVILTIVLKAACNPENCTCTLEKINHLKRRKAGTEL